MLGDMPLEPSWAVDDPGSWQRIRERVEVVLASAAALDTLRSEYIAIFDRGRGHTSLYETEYGREHALVKGNALADIAGFYRAFGLEFGHQEGVHEMLDHVSVELEFYALLLMKQEALAAGTDADGQAIVLEARQKFLDAHLGRFMSAIAKRPGVTASAFYGPVLAWCRNLVAQECARLGISPVSVDWLSTCDDPEEMSCGGNCTFLEGNHGPVPAR
jgi:nitrate reductase assembly molybdenum cofactor insertion protein NarJ